MAESRLGKLTTDTGRDAEHVAIIGVVAGELLKPGQHISITPAMRAVSNGHKIAIVDPFLTEDIQAGQSCYAVMYPGTVSNLHHAWTHDLVKNEDTELDYGYDECRNC